MVAWNLLESHAFIVELGLVLGAVGCRQAAGGAHDSWWWCGCLSGRDRCSRRTDQTNGIKFIPFVCPSSIPTTAPHRTARPPGSDRCLRRTDESDKILFICPSSIPTTAPRARPAQMTVDRLKTDRRILFFFTYLSGHRASYQFRATSATINTKLAATMTMTVTTTMYHTMNIYTCTVSISSDTSPFDCT
jgi:hypothetical protein